VRRRVRQEAHVYVTARECVQVHPPSRDAGGAQRGGGMREPAEALPARFEGRIAEISAFTPTTPRHREVPNDATSLGVRAGAAISKR